MGAFLLVISVNTLQKVLILIHGANCLVAAVCTVMAVILHQCVTRSWRVAPAWVRELIDEMDGVKKVGCYWVNRLSGMGIRSPCL